MGDVTLGLSPCSSAEGSLMIVSSHITNMTFVCMKIMFVEYFSLWKPLIPFNVFSALNTRTYGVQGNVFCIASVRINCHHRLSSMRRANFDWCCYRNNFQEKQQLYNGRSEVITSIQHFWIGSLGCAFLSMTFNPRLNSRTMLCSFQPNWTTVQIPLGTLSHCMRFPQITKTQSSHI